MDERIKTVISNLQRNNMAGYLVENQSELLRLMAALIKKAKKLDAETPQHLRNGRIRFYSKR